MPPGWGEPDQRLHADARGLTELMSDLGIGLLQSTLLLLLFIGVLRAERHDSPHCGSRVSCARLSGVVRTSTRARPLSSAGLLGRPLAELNAERYAREGGAAL